MINYTNVTTDLESVFLKLIELEKNETRGVSFDKETGIFHYMNNMPLCNININDMKVSDFDKNSEDRLYMISRLGDLVLNIKVIGNFKSAMLFQYDWTGSIRIVYDHLFCKEGYNCVNINPFPTSGYPLLPSGKALYLEVLEIDINSNNVEVVVEYAFLDAESRRDLVKYREGGSDDGVKVVHSNGTIYQVLNMNDWGYSPNYLGPI